MNLIKFARRALPPISATLYRGIVHARHARGYARLWRASGRSGLVAFANEAQPERIALTGMANEFDPAAGQGWARIPYGQWPHEKGLQRFGQPEAAAMVGYWKNTWNRIKRAVVGMPIFRGHPDLPALANQYPDKAVYGTIADMEARHDGLYIRPILSEAGASLVNEKGLKSFSPHWLARKLPDENGQPVYAPAYLVSIGLTDRPNIGGTSLVNSQPQTENTMPQWLLALLGLANEATEEQVKSKVTDLVARPETTALTNESTARAAAETKVRELTDQLAAHETSLANERTALANEKTALANERKAHRETLVGHAIAQGRITEANKAVWLERLERDFAKESVALANEKPVVKTTPKTAELGSRKNTSAAAEKFTALVNERTAKGETWTNAWNAVKASADGKALYDQMNQPAA